jgi:negative regulator of flagellin synthesis FlgM
MKISPSNIPSTQNKPVTTAEATSAGATKRTEKSSESAKAAAAKQVDTGAAKAEISPKAREFAQAKAVAGQAPDVREQKIADIKARIAAGKYEVNAQAIADRMVDEHLTSGIG